MTHLMVRSCLEQIDDFAWFDLERAVAQFATRTVVSYGQEVYGGCLEPGYQLESRSDLTECPDCGRWRCERCDWEQVDGGSLNFYYSLYCDACGLFEPENWNVS